MFLTFDSRDDYALSSWYHATAYIQPMSIIFDTFVGIKPIVLPLSSVRLSVCDEVYNIVAIWQILQQKCLNKWIANTHMKTILQLSTTTPTISPQTSQNIKKYHDIFDIFDILKIYLYITSIAVLTTYIELIQYLVIIATVILVF